MMTTPARRLFHLFSLVAVAWLTASLAPAAATPDRPNVVLIMADDVGYECFGCYGSEQYRTPVIDRMAAEGMRFDHCYSQPLCTPSRVKLMTGLSNARNYSAFSVLNRDQVTIGHRFQAVGYKTLVAGKWQLFGAEHYSEQFRGKGTLPEDAGFDQHCLWQVEQLGSRFWNPLLTIDGETRQFDKDDYGPEIVTTHITDFMADACKEQEPFFVYYPMILVHGPFLPTPDSESRESKDRQRNFEDMVAYMDKCIGRIVDKTKELGIADNTLILFVGDNGTHGTLKSTLDGRDIRGGKGKTTDAGTRVPLVAYGPGMVPPGRVSDDLIDFSDFLPTLLQAAGEEVPEGLDGRSFLPQLRGKPGEPREWMYCYYCPRPERQKPVRFVRDQRWKLYGDGRFYDVENDPAEQSPMEEIDTPAEATDAKGKLAAALASMPAEGQTLLRFTPDAVEETSDAQGKYNVLFIISDDLTLTSTSCYGNAVCQTPNIDRLAERGVRFTHAYCQGTYCGPSRASFMSGYYPHATGALGYSSPRSRIGDKATWSQHFKENGYYTARVSKIFHMGVPGGIEKGTDGADDGLSWTERFNSPGPEWKAPGDGETLENNPDGKKPPVGGNTFVVVEADGDDLVHSDGKTATKAVELIEQHKDEPFWLGVGFVRPHVPFVAPRKYFTPFKPYDKMQLPEKIEGDWDDIPTPGINYKTSLNMKMDVRRQKKAMGGYYASVAYMDAQVGKVLDAVEKNGLLEKTIIIFTSDHGYHLGEHDFWAKVSLLDESSQVPLIISVPGQKPAVCDSLVELLDLYPTITSLCGLDVPEGLQGKDISKMLVDPTHEVRDAAFCVAPMRKGFLLREQRYAYIQYNENAAGGIELFDTENDPKQYTNLVDSPEHQEIVERFKAQMASKLSEIRDNDLPKPASKPPGRKKPRKPHADASPSEG